MRRVELAVIHREVFPFFTPWLERILRTRARWIWLDFDDAIYTIDTTSADWRTPFRDASKFSEVAQMADFITVASPVLANWVESKGMKARIQLTVPPAREPVTWCGGHKPDLLWIGSDSTLVQLESKIAILRSHLNCQDVSLEILGGDNVTETIWGERIQAARWSALSETQALSRQRIGIMPLVDNNWSHGKGGYKILQYMSAGLPFVASPVGINSWLAETSGGGVVAASDEDWLLVLSELTNNHDKAKRMGALGFEWLESYRKSFTWDGCILTFLKEVAGLELSESV